MDSFRSRIDEVLATPGIERLVEAYFRPGGPFAGETFDLLGDNPPGVVTRDDLLATTLLDISWRPPALRQLLEPGRFDGHLAAVPADIDLWQADARVLQAATDFQESLRKLDGVGSVTASKLLARKRPRLVPIHDRVVLRVLAPPKGRFWATLAEALEDEALRVRIEELRPSGVGSPSLLRLLDVAIWMRDSGSGTAIAARREI